MRVLYKLNVMLGLAHWPPGYKGEEGGRRQKRILREPGGAQRCRRNILALSGVVAVAGLAGGDLHDLSPFGVRFSPGLRGILVLGIAVIGVQVYWYYLRYNHLWEEAILRIPYRSPDQRLSDADHEHLTHADQTPSFAWKGVDLTSNWAALLLTLVSWFWIACWVLRANS